MAEESEEAEEEEVRGLGRDLTNIQLNQQVRSGIEAAKIRHRNAANYITTVENDD
jgi:hypothetical protein